MTDVLAKRRARWAISGIFFANGTVIGSWAAHIPLVEERLGIGHAALGGALLCMALGGIIAMPLGGAAIARFGSAAVTRVSSLVFLASLPLPVLSPDPLLLALSLLVFGAANGVMDVAMNAHAVAVENRLGRPVMSSIHGMFALGGLVGAGLAALLLPVMPPLGHAFLASTALILLAAPALVHLLPAGVDRGSGEAGFVLPNKATMHLGILCCLAMASEGAVLDWSALHLRGSLDLGAGLAATGFAAFSAAMAGGRFAGDWLRGRVGAVALVRGSALLSAAGLTLALVVPYPSLAILGFALVGLGISNLVPIFFGAAGQLQGQGTGTAIAAVATMGYGGFLAGPPLIGFIAEASSLALALGLIVLACAAIGLAATAVRPAKHSEAVAVV